MPVHALRTGLTAVIMLLATAALSVHAQEQAAPRFPRSQITTAEWDAYLREVKAKPSAEIINRPDAPDMTVIAVPGEHAMYYFTQSGPAHPAVIVVRVESRDGAVSIRHNGHFAGSEKAFAAWFLDVTKQIDGMRRSMTAP
jgi:hypothetical protein